MYTDDRPDDIEDDDEEDSGSDEEEGDFESDEEDENSESDEEEAGSTDEDSEVEEDQRGDDQPGDDQPMENQGGDDQGGDTPGGGSKKRGREDDNDDDGNDGQDDDEPPPRKTRRLGSFPTEVQLQIMQSLDFAQLWNLAMASPEGYLGDSINVFLLDAYRQYAIDYPDALNDDADDGDDDNGGSDSDDDSSDSSDSSGGSGSGISEDSEESDSDTRSDDDPDRPLSLLQWVGRRVIYDSEFRTAWRPYINQLIDTYLQVYGPRIPATANENVIEDILWYFRPRAGTYSLTPLMHAAADNRPDVVHLLLLRGEDVNQRAFDDSPITALTQATYDLNTRPGGVNGMQTVFALIGAGADVTNLQRHARAHARQTLLDFMPYVPTRGEVHDYRWPRIVNPRGLSVREFIADERSDYFDRIILAMFAIHIGSFDYPEFV